MVKNIMTDPSLRYILYFRDRSILPKEVQRHTYKDTHALYVRDYKIQGKNVIYNIENFNVKTGEKEYTEYTSITSNLAYVEDLKRVGKTALIYSANS